MIFIFIRKEVENYEFYENFLLETYKKQLLAEETTYNSLKSDLVAYASDKLVVELLSVLEEVWAKVIYSAKATSLRELLSASLFSTSSMPRKKSDDGAVLAIKEEVSNFKKKIAKIFEKINPSDKRFLK